MDLIKNNTTTVIILITIVLAGVILALAGSVAEDKKQASQEYLDQVNQVSLEGLVEEFDIEGRDHVEPGVEIASDNYESNPPTSGLHWSEAPTWGIYDEPLADAAAVHGLEHGGIWISYLPTISDRDLDVLTSIQKSNKGSVILSPREGNDTTIAVASWGKLMELTEADKLVIQKYINTYKNQSPEKLAW